MHYKHLLIFSQIITDITKLFNIPQLQLKTLSLPQSLIIYKPQKPSSSLQSKTSQTTHMALFQNQSLLLAFMLLLSLTFGRELLQSNPNPNPNSLEARLISGLTSNGSGGLSDCWNAMMELRSCTNEIVLFFLNGESYLSIPCCRAIRLITHKCWPSMFVSIGFTAQEGDILRGYCDAEAAAASPPPSPAPSSSADSRAMVVGDELMV